MGIHCTLCGAFLYCPLLVLTPSRDGSTELMAMPQSEHSPNLTEGFNRDVTEGYQYSINCIDKKVKQAMCRLHPVVTSSWMVAWTAE